MRDTKNLKSCQAGTMQEKEENICEVIPFH